MDKKLKLIQRCSSIPILLAVLCGILPAQSSISGNLYDNTVAVDTVAIGACCSPTAARIGGITIQNSVISGSGSAVPVSVRDVNAASVRKAPSCSRLNHKEGLHCQRLIERSNCRYRHHRARGERQTRMSSASSPKTCFSGSVSSSTRE
jgi:hypothetical protein